MVKLPDLLEEKAKQVPSEEKINTFADIFQVAEYKPFTHIALIVVDDLKAAEGWV